MSDPVRRSFTNEDLSEAAKLYMIARYGKPSELDFDRRMVWHERLGMLTDFVQCLWDNKFE